MVIRKVTYCRGCGSTRRDLEDLNIQALGNFWDNLKFNNFRKCYMCTACYRSFPGMSASDFREIKYGY